MSWPIASRTPGVAGTALLVAARQTAKVATRIETILGFTVSF
jgi:hypothetical protein